MQLKIHDYERVFRRDPDYKRFRGILSENIKTVIREIPLYVPDTARWFVSEPKEKESKEK